MGELEETWLLVSEADTVELGVPVWVPLRVWLLVSCWLDVAVALGV